MDDICYNSGFVFTSKHTCATYKYYDLKAGNLETKLHEYWIIIASVYIILMQLGFTLLEIGQVNKKNQMNIVSKNFFDICVCTLCFYLCGYALSTNAQGGVIGTGQFLSLGFDHNTYLDWFWKYSQCSASATIVSGSLAERTFVNSYILFIILMSSIIFPIGSSWILGEGWLDKIGMYDASGAGYVHLLGGICGFMGTWVIGPRIGIFDQTNVSKLVKAKNLKNKIMNLKNEKVPGKKFLRTILAD